ncbi:beta-propeller fold lactonase family protein [Granulicella sp. dw_53]|uniref:lactonase family protein n=1 Tax=Granulicella sp. dw_53 TaxID=2719792 RepID=UPI001BD5B027|nr:beta-propeller fold lactonase family protein [Granulicella sp. dw_53]
MKLSKIGRISMAFVVSVAMGLGMTSCGGGTVGFMWALGTQFNQISGFKIDNFTGNLTNIVGTPFSSGGTNPVSIVVRTGGRYVYVVNKGAGTSAGNVAEFSVGGDGVLTFQGTFTTQGKTPVWAAMDTSGNFLYVLDQLSPDGVNGDITVFSIAADTGRLSLVPNNSFKNPDGTQLTYFPVGSKPIMTRMTGACLFTVDSGDNTVFAYGTNSSTGQLTTTTNSTITTQATRLTSINAGSTYVYLTDAGATPDSSGGFILPYTVGTNCSLQTLTGGSVPNLPLTSNPSYSFTDLRNRYLYVLNQSTTNTMNASSTISAFTIDQTNGKLQPIADSNNPYPIGAGPMCMVEDPTFQYVYTSNNVSNTVTGKIINQNTGQLSDLRRGSSFPSTGQPTCLVISGSVN